MLNTLLYYSCIFHQQSNLLQVISSPVAQNVMATICNDQWYKHPDWKGYLRGLYFHPEAQPQVCREETGTVCGSYIITTPAPTHTVSLQTFSGCSEWGSWTPLLWTWASTQPNFDPWNKARKSRNCTSDLSFLTWGSAASQCCRALPLMDQWSHDLHQEASRTPVNPALSPRQ